MSLTRSTTLLAGSALVLLTLVDAISSFGVGSTPSPYHNPVKHANSRRVLSETSARPPARRLSEADGSSNSRLTAQIVNRCKIYSNDTCQYCIRDYYLINNECKEIAVDRLILNCNVYSTNATCYLCDTGFFVGGNGTTCEKNTLSFCATQTSAAVCSKCVAGSFLANGTCSAPLPNCLEAQSATQCKSCSLNYYLNASICTTVPAAQVIAYCSVYVNNLSQCAACAKGYALDPNGKTCWSQAQVSQTIDPNCDQAVINTGQSCQVCRQGYYLKNQTCAKAEADDSEGCFIVNWNAPSTCLVCMPGFNMYPNSTCIFNNEVKSGLQDPLKHTAITSALLAIAVGLLLLTN